MPLSEDEQRRLDEMERALRRDDPKFAAGQSIEHIWLRRTVAAGAAVLIGTVLLVAGSSRYRRYSCWVPPSAPQPDNQKPTAQPAGHARLSSTNHVGGLSHL